MKPLEFSKRFDFEEAYKSFLKKQREKSPWLWPPSLTSRRPTITHANVCSLAEDYYE